MIARSWRCIASSENAPLYLVHFQDSVLPELNKLGGFHGYYILSQTLIEETRLELTVITFWESLDAIRAFAGENFSQAVVEPQAKAVLISFDETVTHYEVVKTSY